MSGTGQGELPDDFFDLVDVYCSGLIDEDGFHRLEAILLESADARRHFVDYFHHHTEIQFAVRAGRAADAVLDSSRRLATGSRSRDVGQSAGGYVGARSAAGGSGSRREWS